MLERRTPLRRSTRIGRRTRLETRVQLERKTRRARTIYPVVSQDGGCWFARLPDAGPCDGRLVHCHLIDQQRLRKRFPNGHDGRTLNDLLADPRIWVWGCGGLSGFAGHHGALDSSRKFVIARNQLPASVEEFALEHNLTAWLEHRYGPFAEAA